MLTAVATKSLKIVIFNHLMLVDANCDDSVTIPKVPKPLKVSVALEKNQLSRIYVRNLGTPLFQILDPPLHPMPTPYPQWNRGTSDTFGTSLCREVVLLD